jgi:hypothetical protein
MTNLCSITYTLNYYLLKTKKFAIHIVTIIMYFMHTFLHQTSQIASMCFMFQNKKSMFEIKQKSMFHLFSSPLPITLHIYHLFHVYSLLHNLSKNSL